MFSSKPFELLLLSHILDLMLASLAWIASYYLRFYTIFAISKGIPDFSQYLKLLPVLWLAWISIMIHRPHTQRHHMFSMIRSSLQDTFITSLIFTLLSYFYSEFYYSRLSIFIFLILQPFFILIGRWGMLKLYQKTSQKNRLRILIVSDATRLKDALAVGRSYPSHMTCAFFGSPDQRVLTQRYCEKHNVGFIDTPTDWIETLKLYNIQCLIFAVSEESSQLSSIIKTCYPQIPNILILPKVSEVLSFPLGVEIIEDHPVIHLHVSPLQGQMGAMKRLIDLFGAGFALLFFSPIMLGISVLIKVTSQGPIFYKQVRMGIDGHTFTMLKFRSMPVSAEANGAIFNRKDDDRATKIGHLLRRTSLDELPQFLNVLMGDMSLVGPRPERPVFVEQFRVSIPNYMLRHKVKAGITGWAQIHGLRGDTSIEARIEHDIHYIKNWSLTLDLKILLLTVIKGFVNKNAY